MMRVTTQMLNESARGQDLCRIGSQREENDKQYNDFLNKLVINRVAPGIVIKRR